MERTCYRSKRGKHSEKPDYFYSIIEKSTKDYPRKIELFARKHLEGWDVWGNEAPEGIQTRLKTTKE